MRVLLDIVHPADVLFFHHPILKLREKGHTVAIASRERDITTVVLDRLGHAHQPLSVAGSGAPHFMFELARRDAAMLRLAREFKPDVLAGFGGVSISHVGKLFGIPSLSFYDTEIAYLQLLVTLPFITEWHVPNSYTGRVPRGRTYRFAGPARLSYFHPRNFKPDRSRAIGAGLDPDRPNFLVRTVAWSSNHDLGKRGWSMEQLRKLVSRLSALGRVHISAEGGVAPEFEAFRYRGDVLDLHHLMAHCRAYVGESATMAAEAAILGVPAIYGIGDYRGYVDELAQKGLVQPSDGAAESMVELVEGILDRDPQHWLLRRDRALAEWIDVSDYVVNAIDRCGRKPNSPRVD